MKVVKVLLLLMSLLWTQPTFVCAQNEEDQTLTGMKADLESMKELYNQKKAAFDKEKGNLPENIRKRRQGAIEEMAKKIQIMEEDIQKYIEEKKKGNDTTVSETVSEIKQPRQIPISIYQREYIYIDDQPFCLKLRYGTAKEKDDKILIEADSYTGKLELLLKKATPEHYDYKELDGIEKIIKEKVIPYISVQDGVEMKIGYVARFDAMNNYVEYVATYKNGVFLGQKETEQAEAKKAAAEKAAHNAKTVSFKKKYGFDPSVNNIKYIVKVGRNILNIVDARNEWVQEYGDDRNAKVSVKLSIDHGASKCYDFYWMNGAYYMGFFWVKNNVITSVSWK